MIDKDQPTVDDALLEKPLSKEESQTVELEKGPNIASIPEMEELPDRIEIPVLLKMKDNISTDEILAGGARVLPFRSNLPEISKFTFEQVDESYHERAMDVRDKGGHAIIGGYNYGQGSSREHAALAPRYLGLRVAIAKDFARIHWQNLVNFGILPLTFLDESDYEDLEEGDVLEIVDVKEQLNSGNELTVQLKKKDKRFKIEHHLSERQVDIVLKGGLINWERKRQESHTS